jgi:hypothetical protein
MAPLFLLLNESESSADNRELPTTAIPLQLLCFLNHIIGSPISKKLNGSTIQSLCEPKDLATLVSFGFEGSRTGHGYRHQRPA